MSSYIERYMKKIKEIVPSYEGSKRGRGQCILLSKLSTEDRKKFLLLENKIRLERNRLCAKRNRDKKKSNLENLKSSVDKLTRENIKLKQQIEKLKKKVTPISNEKEEVEKIKDSLKFKDISGLDFLNIEMDEPIVFDV